MTLLETIAEGKGSTPTSSFSAKKRKSGYKDVGRLRGDASFQKAVHQQFFMDGRIEFGKIEFPDDVVFVALSNTSKKKAPGREIRPKDIAPQD